MGSMEQTRMRLAVTPLPPPPSAFSRVAAGVSLLALLLIAAPGCRTGPELLKNQPSIDRAIVEYPPGFDLRRHMTGLTAPSAIAFDADGSLLIAESGVDDNDVRIFGFKKDGTRLDIFPTGRRIPFLKRGFQMHAPIGGMVATGGKIFVTRRDDQGRGRITAFS